MPPTVIPSAGKTSRPLRSHAGAKSKSARRRDMLKKSDSSPSTWPGQMLVCACTCQRDAA